MSSFYSPVSFLCRCGVSGIGLIGCASILVDGKVNYPKLSTFLDGINGIDGMGRIGPIGRIGWLCERPGFLAREFGPIFFVLYILVRREGRFTNGRVKNS